MIERIQIFYYVVFKLRHGKWNPTFEVFESFEWNLFWPIGSIWCLLIFKLISQNNNTKQSLAVFYTLFSRNGNLRSQNKYLF